MAYYCHPSAVVDGDAQIGDDTKIWHFSHVSSKAVIGARCAAGGTVRLIAVEHRRGV